MSERSFTRDDAVVASIKRDLRTAGWYVRYTEWPSGHQVVLHQRDDTSRHVVTDWQPTELEAFVSARRLAADADAELRSREMAPLH
jgi:hypothetical protein